MEPSGATVALRELQKKGKSQEMLRSMAEWRRSRLRLDVFHFAVAIKAFQETSWPTSLHLLKDARGLGLRPNEYMHLGCIFLLHFECFAQVFCHEFSLEMGGELPF